MNGKLVSNAVRCLGLLFVLAAFGASAPATAQCFQGLGRFGGGGLCVVLAGIGIKLIAYRQRVL